MRYMKELVRHVSPGAYELLRHRFGHPARYRRAADIVRARNGMTVASGPFCGMKLASAVTGSYVPKMLGVYERELHHVVEQIVELRPSHVINVGCGEGYYLVGMAIRLPAANCIGFDIDEAARRACLEQGRLNGVAERLEIRSFCDHAALAQLPLRSAVLIADCEGYEAELLNPRQVHGLYGCPILVELHELFAPGVTQCLKQRFEPTHSITLIDSTPRNSAEFPVLRGLSARDAAMVVSESRYAQMQWAWMTPRHHAATEA
jgi:hypothetical protein